MNAAGETVRLSLEAATRLCEAAALRLGATAETALSLARAAVAAEAEGQPSVGLAHFVDYLDAMAAGRIDAGAKPRLSRPAATMIVSDVRGGAAHTGFDAAFADVVATARSLGMALFSQKNAYTCGALGYFTGRLAEAGLVAIAATNGPPLLAGSGGTKAVYCTNPLAFSAPSADGRHLTIDQASSATAFVNIRKAARAGESIPAGWALDAEGQPTTDAARAVKGVLLAFGGSRGANIALMVEVLSAAMTGANWSVDAPSFTSGSQSPGTGMLVLALRPELIDPDFQDRMAGHLERLRRDFGVHIPGQAKRQAREEAGKTGVQIPLELQKRISDYR